MKIGFIGAGKVGFSLGKHFSEHNINVTGYYSLHSSSSMEAANFTHSKYYDSIEQLISESDIIFITVPDGIISKIYEIIRHSDLSDKCIAHCSGALSSNIFYDIEKKGGLSCSVHPLCAISSKQTGHLDIAHAYFTLEGTGYGPVSDLLAICKNTYEIISAENKIKYHAAAVFASNLVIGLYETSTNLLRECGLSKEFSEDALKSLFLGNAVNITEKGCVQALTGPLERADSQTVLKHLSSLNATEHEIYKLLSHKLLPIAAQKNPDRNYQDIANILSEI